MRFHACIPVTTTFVALTSIASAAPQARWTPWADAGAFYNNQDDGRAEVTIWAPLDQSPDSVTFLDLRGKLFDASEVEGNIALGYREQQDGWNLGFWGGIDFRRSSLDSTFPQLSGGVEALSQDWDVRMNGYLPLKDRNFISSSSTSIGGGAPTVLLNGSSILLQTGINSTTTVVDELAFGGVDAEVGVRIPLEAFDADPKSLDLRLYGGGFYFENSDAPESISGPKARLELRINDVIDSLPGSRLTLEAEYTDDDVRGNRSEVGLRLRVPLNDDGPSFATQSPLDTRMTEALRRDTDIVASANTTSTTVNTLTTETVKDAATGVVLSNVVYLDGSASGGLSSVAQASNTLIIAQGGNGTIAPNTFNSNQTLVGGGGTLTLQGTTSGTLVQFAVPGSQPTFLAGASFFGVNTNTHISGISLDATQTAFPGFNIPSGVQITNVVIDHNTLLGNSGATMIQARGASGLTIANNSISGSSIGVAFADVSNSRIGNNSITATFVGVIVSSATSLTYSNVVIDSNTIVTPQNSSNTRGIYVSIQGNASQLDITNNTVTSYLPIFVQSSGSTGSIAGNSLNAANGSSALDLGGTNNTFIGSGNTSTNPSATACFANSNPASNVQFVGGGTCP